MVSKADGSDCHPDEPDCISHGYTMCRVCWEAAMQDLDRQIRQEERANARRRRY